MKVYSHTEMVDATELGYREGLKRGFQVAREFPTFTLEDMQDLAGNLWTNFLKVVGPFMF